MKIKTITPKINRYDETHPNSGEYIVLGIDSYDESNPNLPYKGKTMYTIWTGQFYEQYDSSYFEIIDSRISKYWHFNVISSCITMGIKYWIEDIYYSYKILHERTSPEYYIFQKYRKMMENEFLEKIDNGNEDYISYDLISDDNYIYESEPVVIIPPIGKNL